MEACLEVIKSMSSKDVEGGVLIKQIQVLMNLFEGSKVSHSFREANDCAYMLVKVGKDRPPDLEFSRCCPLFCYGYFI